MALSEKIVAFQGDSGFYDNKNYPRGFDRYGIFTTKEVKILVTYGYSLLALQNGERQAIGPEEKQFLLVVSGQQLPCSDIEKAWVKYQNSINQKKRYINPFGSCSTEEASNDDEPAAEDGDFEDQD